MKLFSCLMHLPKHQLALSSITLCTIIWSIDSPIYKWALQDIHPFTLAFFRFLLATGIMFVLSKGKIKIKFDDFYKIVLLAITGITLVISFYYLGLSFTQSINEPIIASILPVLLIIGSMIFLHEIPKRKILFGTIISLIGVLIIIVRPTDHLSLYGSILGNILFILSILSLACYTLLLKKFKLSYSSPKLLFWIFLVATIVFFPMFVFEAKATHSFTRFNFRGIFGIIYGAVFSSTFATNFYNYGVKYLKTSEVGIFTYLGPFITALVAIPLLQEQITFAYLLGSLFVFLGLFIAEANLHYHPFRHHLKEVNDPWLESGP